MQPLISVVDDDALIGLALAGLLESAGYKARSFTSANAFPAAYDPEVPGCVVTGRPSSHCATLLKIYSGPGSHPLAREREPAMLTWEVPRRALSGASGILRTVAGA